MKLKSKSPISIPALIISFGILAAVFYLNQNSNTSSESLPGYLLENVFGDAQIFSASQNIWIKGTRGYAFNPGDILKTGKDGEVDFQIPDVSRMRLKPESELYFPKAQKAKNAEPAFRTELRKGTLFAASEDSISPHPLEIIVGSVKTVSRNNMTLAATQTGMNEGFLGMLKGTASLTDLRGKFYGTIRSMEKVVIQSSPSKPFAEKISQSDWRQISEAYELIPKSAASEAAQLDLSKKAGNLFDYVFDHGTFYTPKIGYANREFKLDPLSGEVYLEMEYDVFPVGSFSGLYMKTRDLDMSQFKTLRFMARRNPHERGFPENFRIELKSASGVLRAFSVKRIEKDWAVFDFPLNFSKKADIREINFVFLQERIGGYSKGFLEAKNFTLLPKDPPPSPEPVSTSKMEAPDAAKSLPTEDDLLAELHRT